MKHTVTMGHDGIIRIIMNGPVGKTEIETLQNDLQPFLEASTEENPIRYIMDAREAGEFSTEGRRGFYQINADPRVGKGAIINASRPLYVLNTLVQKASGKDNTRIMGSEAEAIAWIKG